MENGEENNRTDRNRKKYDNNNNTMNIIRVYFSVNSPFFFSARRLFVIPRCAGYSFAYYNILRTAQYTRYFSWLCAVVCVLSDTFRVCRWQNYWAFHMHELRESHIWAAMSECDASCACCIFVWHELACCRKQAVNVHVRQIVLMSTTNIILPANILQRSNVAVVSRGKWRAHVRKREKERER